MFYVVEVQTSDIGAVLPFAFDNRPDAEAKYHDLLRIAAKSSVPKHGVMLLDEDLFVLKSEHYDHSANVTE